MVGKGSLVVVLMALLAGAGFTTWSAWAKEPKAAKKAASRKTTSAPAADKSASQKSPPIGQPLPSVAVLTDEERSMPALRARLSKRLDLRKLREESTLIDFVEGLSKAIGLTIIFDERSLDEIGIGSDSPLTVDLPDSTSGDVALQLALRDVDPELHWTLKDGAVEITTREVHAENLVLKLHDVTDLVGGDLQLQAEEADFDPLVELVLTVVNPDAWHEAGGTSLIRGLGAVGIRTLAVKTTPEMHDQVENLLRAVRRQKHKPEDGLVWAEDGGADEVTSQSEETAESPAKEVKRRLPTPNPTVVLHPSINEVEQLVLAGILKKLEQQIDLTPLKAKQMDLEDFVNYLNDQTSLEFAFDEPALDELGISLDSPIHVDRTGKVTVRNALRRILALVDPELTFMIQNELLTITTKEKESENLATGMFDVADLCIDCACANGKLRSDYHPLVNLITVMVEPDSWEEAGGAGRIAVFKIDGLLSLVVSSTYDVRERIEALLEALRKMRHPGALIGPCGPHKVLDADDPFLQ